MNVRRPPTLFRKRTGFYYALFYDPARAPARKWVALHVKNRRVAENQLARVAARYLEGHEDPWSAVPAHAAPASVLTLAHAVTRFLDARALDGPRGRPLAPRSLEQRARSLAAFAAALPPEATPADVTPADVRRFAERPALSEWSRRTYFGHASAFLEWCRAEGLAPTNAAQGAHRPTVTRRAVLYLDPDQIARLLAAIDAHAEHVEAERRSIHGGARGARAGTVRWYADVVRFAVYTGLRLGELCALRWNAVRGPYLAVTSDADHRTKSGHERTIPLVPQARAILDARREAGPHAPADPVFRNTFGGPLSEASTSRLFRTYREKAALPATLTFHTLRKTCGVALASAGVDIRTIQSILGHADIRLTGQIYTDVLKSSLNAEMHRAFERYAA